MEMATAIAVNPAGTLVAIYATDYRNYDYDEFSFIFLVNADSGHYVIDILEIDHRDGDNTLVAEAQGIYFDNYGMVYFARSHYGGNYMNSDGGGITDYASRFSITAYNTTTKALEFDWFEGQYFGEA